MSVTALQLLLYFGLGEHLGGRGAQLFREIGRAACGQPHAVPAVGHDIDARFLQGRHVRQEGRARRSADRHDPDAAGAVLRDGVRQRRHRKGQVATEQIGDDRRRAAIGNAGHGQASSTFSIWKPVKCGMVPLRRHAIAGLRRIGLDPGHQLLEVVDSDRRTRRPRRIRNAQAARPGRNPWPCRSSAGSPPSAADTSSGPW